LRKDGEAKLRNALKEEKVIKGRSGQGYTYPEEGQVTYWKVKGRRKERVKRRVNQSRKKKGGEERGLKW